MATRREFLESASVATLGLTLAGCQGTENRSDARGAANQETQNLTLKIGGLILFKEGVDKSLDLVVLKGSDGRDHHLDLVLPLAHFGPAADERERLSEADARRFRLEGGSYKKIRITTPKTFAVDGASSPHRPYPHSLKQLARLGKALQTVGHASATLKPLDPNDIVNLPYGTLSDGESRYKVCELHKKEWEFKKKGSGNFHKQQLTDTINSDITASKPVTIRVDGNSYPATTTGTVEAYLLNLPDLPNEAEDPKMLVHFAHYYDLYDNVTGGPSSYPIPQVDVVCARDVAVPLADPVFCPPGDCCA